MALRKLSASDLGNAEYISATVPMHRKGSARTLEVRKLAYYPELGGTAESAQAFADAIAESARALGARRDAELREPSIGFDLSAVPMPDAVARHRCADHAARIMGRKLAGDRVAFACDCGESFAETVAAPEVPARGSRPMPSYQDAGLAELAERFRTRDRVASRATTVALGARLAAERAAIAYAETLARVTRELATSGPTAAEVRAAPEPDAPDAPDALATCNACEVRPAVGPGHPGYAAGYCAECYAESVTDPNAAELEANDHVHAPADANAVQVRADGVTVATTRRLELTAPAPEPPAPEPAVYVRTIRRGPADAAADMIAGDGWTLPRADAERLGLAAPSAYAEPALADCRTCGAIVRWHTGAELVGWVHTGSPIGETHAPDVAGWPARELEPAPVAELEASAEPRRLASVPAPEPRTRPTCDRCGQTFRASGAGLAWHTANRPDCATAGARRLAIA